jgi:hypothetical protein
MGDPTEEETLVEGTADILSLPDALEPLVDYRRRFAVARMVRERRVLIRIAAERGGADRQG